MRIGVIGVGYLGKYHLEKYLGIEGVEVAGVCDTNEQIGMKIGADYGVPYILDYRRLFDMVDAVSVVVPTVHHHQVAVDFLNAGIDVFVEKPITTNLIEAQSLIDTAESRGLILQVGHLERFNPAVLALEGTMREPMFIESHRLSPFPDRSVDIDVILDLMIHDIDIILNIVKSPISHIDAVGVPIITSQVDIVNARLNFESGCVANVTASRVSAEKMRKIRIFQSDAYISIDYAAQKITVYKRVDGGNDGISIIRQDIEISHSDYLGDEIKSFVDAVRTRNNPSVTGRDGKRALEVAMMIKERLEESMTRLRERGILTP
ncbi:MAG: Gfo/Idh/MocA family oxidoreductase [Deltaproteobacteria bacterium]|nr:Gfo/Idh/MocA family oxidoreductase [Candidatus Zymogenaceae bacterium]